MSIPSDDRIENNSQIPLVKGHLHFKMITFQNVSSEAQIKNFFIS